MGIFGCKKVNCDEMDEDRPFIKIAHEHASHKHQLRFLVHIVFYLFSCTAWGDVMHDALFTFYRCKGVLLGQKVIESICGNNKMYVSLLRPNYLMFIFNVFLLICFPRSSPQIGLSSRRPRLSFCHAAVQGDASQNHEFFTVGCHQDFGFLIMIRKIFFFRIWGKMTSF